MRHEMHQEHPERIDACRHRDGIDHRGKEHHAGAAVEQFADAEISIDAGRQREDRGREFQRDFQAGDAFRQLQGSRRAGRQGLRGEGSIRGHDERSVRFKTN